MSLRATIWPRVILKAQEYVECTHCFRCNGRLVLEECYSLESDPIMQFRCLECGWRDDITYLEQLVERERDREERRHGCGYNMNGNASEAS